MILIPDVFPKLRTPNEVVKSISKKYRFKGLLNRQHEKWAETLFQSQPKHF